MTIYINGVRSSVGGGATYQSGGYGNFWAGAVAALPGAPANGDQVILYNTDNTFSRIYSYVNGSWEFTDIA